MSSKQKYICIHGHFYQPPRENPWLESIEMQDSAFPFHDWNERITFECYAANTASRILGSDQDIVDIVNNYSRISFNFGPTLLSWMEQQDPDAYQAILQADRDSLDNFSGHGSALAQVYNHIIMPLASRQDKYTQIIWGIRDFEYRFKRKPEGMWLAETAVDTDTLDILAENGIQFTVLAPRQAKAVRRMGDSNWTDVSGDRVNPRVPYLCRLPSGRSIVLFFYDGLVSQDVAFKGLLKNGQHFADRLMQAFPDDDGMEAQLVHIATDGESYGHHHRHGDMALAYCLSHIEAHSLAKITNYGEFLSKFPPVYEAQIFENSSWSCVHGVERWRNNCGCNSGGNPHWHQQWRAPLRQALDWLRDELIPVYEKGMKRCVNDPWAVRNDFIEVILHRSPETIERFMQKHLCREVSDAEKILFVKLLEMQRHALLMYTSCGWFFDEVSGIETIQILQYASRAIQLAEEVHPVTSIFQLEKTFLQKLAAVPSNLSQYGNAAVLYEQKVKPARLTMTRVGAHYAIVSLFEEYPDQLPIYSYLFRSEVYDRLEAGVQKLAIGMAKVISTLTLEESLVSFVVLYLGQQTIIAHAREDMPADTFAEMHRTVREAFVQGQIGETIHLMDRFFGTQLFSLTYLSKDEQRKVLDRIMQNTLESIENSFRHIYEHNYHMMNLMNRTDTPLPSVFKTTVEVVIQADLRAVFQSPMPNIEEMRRLSQEVKRWQVKPDTDTVGFPAIKRLNVLMKQLESTPSVEQVKYLAEWMRELKTLPLVLDLWIAQNIYFFVGNRYYGEIRDLAQKGDHSAQRWLKYFTELGELLDVKIV
jgi:alpha-amylase/alpha-mannosidase (GH57 family)